MSTTIPTTEPVAIRAGDTWRWKRTLSDYAATTWTLSYTLFNSAGIISITASADGVDHLIDVAPETTDDYTAGRYDWVAHVTDGTDKFQVGAGSMQLLPDLAAVSTYDGRSHARTVLDAIDALIEGRATSGQIDLVSTAVDTESITKRPELLLKWRQYYAAAVASEEQAAAVARGDNLGRIVQVRFT